MKPMCRLLGIYGEVNGWSEVALEFRKLAEDGMVPPICAEPGHRDGWGMAAANDDRTSMRVVERRMGSANESALYENTVHGFGAQPYIFICHIRKASPGIPVTIGNVHPFASGGWAFVHNGTIHDYARLPVDPAFHLTSDGSDSECFFSYLMGKMKAAASGSDRVKLLGEAMASLDIDYTSLNCILSNGSELYAIRDYMKFGEYLSLFYYPLPKGVVVCSEPLAVDGLQKSRWQAVPNQSILRVHGAPPVCELSGYRSTV
jgi:predicted glutamine amidotransferase